MCFFFLVENYFGWLQLSQKGPILLKKFTKCFYFIKILLLAKDTIKGFIFVLYNLKYVQRIKIFLNEQCTFSKT